VTKLFTIRIRNRILIKVIFVSMVDLANKVTEIQLNYAVSDAFNAVQERVKDAINGILAHEILIGDIQYIPNASKIVMPFDIHTQFFYSVQAGLSVDHAKLLAFGRYFVLTWWNDVLGAVDKNEAIVIDGAKTRIAVDETKAITEFKIDGDISHFPNTEAKTYPHAMPKVTDVIKKPGELTIVPGVTYQTFQLHMLNAALAISMNLVKTGHHYQDKANGTFKALEKKLYGKDMFSEPERSLIYHDLIHPFSQMGKRLIYTSVKSNPGRYKSIDSTLFKRIPVVPQGAAWLAAGVSIMEEVRSVPKLSVGIPDQYIVLIDAARTTIERAKDTMTVVPSEVRPYEAMCAFSYGVLYVVAPGHSAIKALSLVKMAEQHLGARLAGEEFARSLM